MKKRIAVILVLALVCCMVAGVMPASAATNVTNYYALSINGTAKLDISSELTGGKTYVIDQSYNHSTIQVLDDAKGGITIVGVAYGTTNLIVNIFDGSVHTKSYTCSVNVSYSGSSGATDVSNAIVALQIRKTNSSYNDLYVNDTFNVSATVKDASGSNDITSKVRYAWSITSGNASVTSNYSGQSATVKVTSGSTAGAAVTGTVTVYGDNGTTKSASFNTASDTIYNSYGSTVAQQGSLLAYGGKVNFTFLDRGNNNAVLDANSIGTLASLSNLPRTYRVPVGSQIGISNRRIVDAAPTSMTFNSTLREYSVIVGVRASGSYSGGSGSIGGITGGVYPLGNGYTIIAAIEAASPVPVMKIGETVQITAAMLGGVPVTAAGMSYTTGDIRIATVTSGGKITALSSGVTTLNVFYNGNKVIEKNIFVAASSSSDVEIDEEDGLVFNVTKLTRKLNTKVRFRVKTITLNGKKIAHKELDWVTTNKRVCTVDKNGYIRTRGKGTCYIVGTTQDGEYTTKLKITVK